MSLTVTQTFLSTLFIMAVGTFVLLSCAAALGYAAASQSTESKQTKPIRPPWLLFIVIAFWFSSAIATSTAGAMSLQLVIPFVLIPVVAGSLLSYTNSLKTLIRAIPTHWLIGLQAYRFVGGIFIYPFLTEGVLTRGFALNAGIGDMLTGLLAIVVALLVRRDGGRWRTVFYAWTILGILDLIVAIASAVYFGFAVEGIAPTFPITTIPLFYGPPFGILIHVITVRNFHLRYGRSTANKLNTTNSMAV